MLPGKKIMAIFGFIEIHNFAATTEIFLTGILLYVNEIAEITHATVD